jgi:hypothetical protein
LPAQAAAPVDTTKMAAPISHNQIVRVISAFLSIPRL